MGRTYDEIPDHLATWMEAQPVWFVASAPLAANGRVNVSPKGGDGFRVLGPRCVAYVDYTGSGAETIAHVRDNGRLTVMFCSFDARPTIVRLHGRGEVLLAGHPDFVPVVAMVPETPGVRSVVRLHVERVSTSCGYAVPRMDLVGPRQRLDAWAAGKDDDELEAYRAAKNATSIDGLPALAP